MVGGSDIKISENTVAVVVISTTDISSEYNVMAGGSKVSVEMRVVVTAGKGTL